MWASGRVWTALLIAGITAGSASLLDGNSSARASPERTSVAHRIGRPPVVPVGDLVAISLRGQVIVMTKAGRIVRTLPGRVGPDQLTEAIQLAPDRRQAWVSVWNVTAMTFRLFRLNLATGVLRRLGNGVSPTLSPQGTELAYIGISPISDGEPGETTLVIQDLRSGQTRTIPFGIGSPFGNPPQLVISWSPDGQDVAVDDGALYRLVNIRTAQSVDSSPAIPARLLAPAYLTARTIVADANCCIGRQQLIALDLRTGHESAFARVSSPVQTVQRIARGTLLITDAGNELVVVTKDRVRLLREGVEAASF